MLDSYFNFTKKSNLVGNLECDFLKNWWWLTFLGHPVHQVYSLILVGNYFELFLRLRLKNNI